MDLEQRARVLITEECNRNCSGCCNKYFKIMEQAKRITTLDELSIYKIISITGGEPLLFPEKTERIIDELKGKKDPPVIYLYSAYYHPSLKKIIPMIGGLHYTVHEGAKEKDFELFYSLQELIKINKKEWKDKSFRLYIDNKVDEPLSILPNVWNQSNVSKWLTEKELLDKQPNGLPLNETLFIYMGE